MSPTRCAIPPCMVRYAISGTERSPQASKRVLLRAMRPGRAYPRTNVAGEPGLRRIGTGGDPRSAVRRSRAQQRHRHDMQPKLAGHRFAAGPRDGRARPWTTRIAEQDDQRSALPEGETESGRRTLEQDRPGYAGSRIGRCRLSGGAGIRAPAPSTFAVGLGAPDAELGAAPAGRFSPRTAAS